MSDVLAYYLFDGDVATHLDRGVELMKKNNFEEAIVQFENVLRLNPHERHARWNRAVSLLALGDYVRGLPEHESAWEIYDWHALGQFKGNIDRILELPIWHGERCRLLVYHEMGFGDAIMLLRFLAELVNRCERVTLVVVPELVSLMQGYGADVIDYVPPISDFDARVTFFNSIFTMGYFKDTIPSAPYIKADFKFDGGRMGIAWSGHSRKELDLNTFLSQLDMGDFDLYALQKTETREKIYVPAVDRNVFPLQSRDFKDTADLIMTMDCIVTVDTAAAHLAGAMGHPNTHLLLPYCRDWRWWHKDVWYPTINIYLQDDIDVWSVPFARLNSVLRK